MALLFRAINSLATLYMLLILVRWLAAWIQLDLSQPRLKWIPKLTDPLVEKIRKHLPHLGPVDFSSIAALFLVWLSKTIILGVIAGAQR